ncbi:MAG: MoaD/ThiS family protein [Candidatus Bathyarchaeota archaeon]|nr:MoaD/ThiS family protein [Candidatus Bathyarchaeota archaeon]
MRVKIRLLGVLRDAGGSKAMIVDAPDDSTVESIIRQLINDDETLRTALWDESVDSPIPNALIMLDGVEVNNLQGTQTPVKPDQELVLLSVVHGG